MNPDDLAVVTSFTRLHVLCQHIFAEMHDTYSMPLVHEFTGSFSSYIHEIIKRLTTKSFHYFTSPSPLLGFINFNELPLMPKSKLSASPLKKNQEHCVRDARQRSKTTWSPACIWEHQPICFLPGGQIHCLSSWWQNGGWSSWRNWPTHFVHPIPGIQSAAAATKFISSGMVTADEYDLSKC